MAGIKEYNARCAAPKTRTREIMKQTNLILMPLARITSAGREGLASGWITGGLRNKQQGGWNYVMETYIEDG